MPKRLIAGNWKMNGLKSSLVEAKLVSDGLSDATDGPEVLICPPATLISSLRDTLAGSAIKFGGQDCHVNASGAHTGDISAEMLADLGCAYGIVGHSECRADHGESSELVASSMMSIFLFSSPLGKTFFSFLFPTISKGRSNENTLPSPTTLLILSSPPIKPTN